MNFSKKIRENVFTNIDDLKTGKLYLTDEEINQVTSGG